MFLLEIPSLDTSWAQSTSVALLALTGVHSHQSAKILLMLFGRNAMSTGTRRMLPCVQDFGVAQMRTVELLSFCR